MLYNKEKLKIINQGIDTLVIGIKITDLFVFNTYFLPFCFRLNELKQDAKNIKTFGNKFVKDDFSLKFGNFFISSRGTSTFAYYFYNDDFLFYVCEADIKSKQYNFKIQFRSISLLKFGHEFCYKNLLKFINSILHISEFSNEYFITLLRFDICCDVKGIKYDNKDFLRFQTLKTYTNFKDNYILDDNLIDEKEQPKNLNSITSISDENLYMRYSDFQGISFGKNPFMFRIYEKIKQIKNKNISPLIFAKWANNGFNINEDKFVFRHEVEFGRPAIKRLLPYKCDDEISFLFSNLDKFWIKGLKICRWHDLTDDEIQRINSNISFQAINKIYERCKNDKNRFAFWDFLHNWDEKVSNIGLNFNDELYEPNLALAVKYLKSFISSVYKNVGTNEEAFYKVFDITEKYLAKDGYTFHSYGLSKICDSFLKNEKNIINNQLTIDNPLETNVISCLFSLINLIESSKTKSDYLFKNTLEVIKSK